MNEKLTPEVIATVIRQCDKDLQDITTTLQILPRCLVLQDAITYLLNLAVTMTVHLCRWMYSLQRCVCLLFTLSSIVLALTVPSLTAPSLSAGSCE